MSGVNIVLVRGPADGKRWEIPLEAFQRGTIAVPVCHEPAKYWTTPRDPELWTNRSTFYHRRPIVLDDDGEGFQVFEWEGPALSEASRRLLKRLDLDL